MTNETQTSTIRERVGPPPPEVEGEPHPADTPLAAAFVAIPPRAVVGVDLDLLLAHLTADGLVLG